MLVGVVLLAIAMIAIIQAGIVIFRSDSVIKRVSFATAMLFGASWSIGVALFLGASSVQGLEIAFKILYGSSDVMIWALLVFILYTVDHPKRKCLAWCSGIVAAAVVLWIVFFNGCFVQSFNLGLPNTASLNPLPYSIYILYFAVYSILIVAVLIQRYKASSFIIERKRISYMLVACSVAFIFGSIFNLILPWLGNYQLIWVGPISVILFAVIIHMAIVRYGLFNIRLLTARLLTWAVALCLLSIACFSIISLGYKDNHIDQDVLTVSIMLLVILFVVFYWAMRYVIQFTEKVFGRKLLDSGLLNQISTKALSHVKVRGMLAGSMGMMEEYLDGGHATAIIDDDGQTIEVGTKRPGLVGQENELIKSVIDSQQSGVLIRGEIDRDTDFFRLLKDKDISAVIKIMKGNTKVSVGYILIQSTPSDLYSEREVQVLMTIGSVISVAIESIRHYEQIRDFNKDLEQRIAEATFDLRVANSKLKRVDDSKDDFISMASHQLRTPLTSVRGYISMLLDGDFGHLTASQRKVLTEAYASSERMTFLISDFLDVSRLQTGKFELRQAPVYLGDLLTSEIDQLQVTAHMRKVNLKYDEPANLPVINADYSKLRQVIMNMIDNAIFYSPEGKTVTVSLYKQQNYLVFSVKDDGIGVPSGEQYKLFSKFYRASNARRVRPDGTGVGLYMAKKIIVAHGGSIIFESHENKGSVFGFRLPLNR